MHWTSIRGVGLIVLAVAMGCGGGDTTHTGPGGRTPDLSDASAYVAASAFSGDLLPCVDAQREPSSCTIGTLPPIARNDSAPTVDDIMDHVVVSHDWMGARLREILERQPDELLRVLGALTAIVVDDDVRPSFYWSLTGAVYVDPRHLWLTPEEEATIGDEQDYRSGFGSELGFVPFSNYLDADGPAFTSGGSTRDLEGRIAAVAALLFHEGAHANDFVPPDQIAGLGAGETFVDAVERLESRRLSGRLVSARSLTSELWAGLARVLYLGEDASDAQKALDAEDVGLAFAPDGASDPYAYSSRQEDLAMLFEETMLKRHFDLDRRVGFATPQSEDGRGCDDYIVGWGTRSRIATPSVAPRAQLVAELILGDPLDAFFGGLPEPTSIPPGQSLCVESALPPASALRWM